MVDSNYSDAMLEIDQGIIKDFIDEFSDMYDLIMSSIEVLEDPNKYNSSSINSIFRGVHSIKSNLRMVGLQDLSNIVHHLENILDEIRQNKTPYITEYGDIIRLVLDETRNSAQKYFNHEPMIGELGYIANAIEYICKNPQNRKEAAEIALKLLDPFKKGEIIKQNLTANTTVKKQKASPTTANDNTYPYIIDDLNFFKQIATLIEQRNQIPEGKMDLVNKVASKMNELGNFVVAQIQLQAAAYVYHWGMSILPISIITKKEMLDDVEIDIVKRCPEVAAALLQDLPFWQPAATIVSQCRERPDGLGYPNKLAKDVICDGAKILAIADAFAAILYAKQYQRLTMRTIMAVILEINNDADRQFDKYWVDIFNQSIKNLHQDQQLFKK
jgi:response regulator RpfG family c-di-GMP phosphodiesterase